MTALMALTAFFVAATAAHAEDWYWRPYQGGANYGAGTGTTYADAWDKDREVNWSGMADGDVLYVCGAHQPVVYDQYLAPTRGGITISGACPGAPGSLRYSAGGAGETVSLRNVASVTVEALEISGCYAGVTIEASMKVRLSRLNIHDCAGFGMRALAGNTADVTVEDSHIWRVGNGIYLGRAGHLRWAVVGNHIHDVSGTDDSHGIGAQSCTSCAFDHNRIERANSGITLYRIGPGEFADLSVRYNVISDLHGAAGSTGIDRGIELTSANCPSNPEWTRDVAIEGNRLTDIRDAAIYVKVGDPAGAQSWAVTVQRNTVRRAGSSLFWNLIRRAEAPGLTPWFPVIGNDWGGVPARSPAFTPNC